MLCSVCLFFELCPSFGQQLVTEQAMHDLRELLPQMADVPAHSSSTDRGAEFADVLP